MILNEQTQLVKIHQRIIFQLASRSPKETTIPQLLQSKLSKGQKTHLKTKNSQSNAGLGSCQPTEKLLATRVILRELMQICHIRQMYNFRGIILILNNHHLQSRFLKDNRLLLRELLCSKLFVHWALNNKKQKKKKKKMKSQYKSLSKKMSFLESLKEFNKWRNNWNKMKIMTLTLWIMMKI